MFAAKLRAHAGTTSACAENTIQTELTLGIDGELPPRARRILLGGAAAAGGAGTTSACAENTVCAGSILPTTGNYLRVRGEYNQAKAAELLKLELPPRARRIHI